MTSTTVTSDPIPLLWDNSFFDTAIRSPGAILKVQAANLIQVSKGYLFSEVITVSNGERILHRMILRNRIDDTALTLVMVSHQIGIPYPCDVTDGFHLPVDHVSTPENQLQFIHGRCESSRSFIKYLGDILSSSRLKTIVESIIANANDMELANSN